MNRKYFRIIIVALLMISFATGCKNLIPDSFEIETTSELGPNTLDRIDDLNDMLDRGVEIGPETRGVIEQLNETIADGVKLGFTDDTLSRVDVLLNMVEQGIGIKVGLDAETNQTVNSLIDTIENAPDQWEGTVTEIIQVLETSTSNVASDIADEVSNLMDDAKVDAQYVTAAVGIEFRCNADFLSDKAGETVDQFIGRTLVGRLRQLVSGESPEAEEPTPWVCQIIPDQVDLEEVGEVIVFQDAVIKITGYNYEPGNLPEAYIVDEAGHKIESGQLFPFLTSPYQMQLNLQGIDFSLIPERSRVEFAWPETGVEYAISVIFPGQEIVATEVPVAMLTINAGSVDILRGPGGSYHVIGGAEMGAEYEVTGRNGNASWFQIDYDGTEGWVQAGLVTRNEVTTPVASIPGPLPNANFEMDPTSGDAPLEITFQNTSTEDRNWKWEYGEGLPTFDKNASHTYTDAGTFQITLTAENDLGFSSITREIIVEQPETIVFQLAPIIMVPLVPLPTPDFPTNSIVFKTFSGLGAPVHFDTGISSEVHECGIVGMSARRGDIEENGFGNIIYANMIPEGNTWYINANFKTHNGQETWSFAVMCLRKADNDGFEVYRRVHVEPASNETIDLSYLEIKENRICGVIGFGAWSGNINEDGQGLYIMKVFTKKNSEGVWELTANFNTHGDHEEVWDVDILCVNNDPSIFRAERLEMIIGRTHRDTGISSSQYACGITGMEILYGDIYEKVRGDILMAVPYIGDNSNWFVYTEFLTHGGEEHWNLDMLCVNRSAATINNDFSLSWPAMFPAP